MRESVTRKDMWRRFAMVVAIFAVIIVLFVIFPKISSVFLLGIPVLSAFSNLFFEDFHLHEPAQKERKKTIRPTHRD